MESGEATRPKGKRIALVAVISAVVLVSSTLVAFFYLQNTTLEDEVAGLLDEILDYESQVWTFQNEIRDLGRQIDNLTVQVVRAYASGFEVGYDEGVKDGVGTGYNIRDPTYQETIAFVASDQTDKNSYDEENYNCFHYTRDFKSNAFDMGYRCGFVYILFQEGAHAIVCFDTVDEDLIFIEPQDDDVVTLTIGQPYWNRTKYQAPDYDDTVISFTIVW